MKKILLLVLIVFLVIFIYNLQLTNHEDLYIGDSFYEMNFDYVYIDSNDYRVTDMIRDINNNILVNNKNIQYLFVKCENIYIAIGNNDLFSTNMTYEKIDVFLNDLEELLLLVRKYSKENIYFDKLDYDYLDTDVKDYLRKKLENLMNKYEVIYNFTNY